MFEKFTNAQTYYDGHNAMIISSLAFRAKNTALPLPVSIQDMQNTTFVDWP